jgi:hypothetical protein
VPKVRTRRAMAKIPTTSGKTTTTAGTCEEISVIDRKSNRPHPHDLLSSGGHGHFSMSQSVTGHVVALYFAERCPHAPKRPRVRTQLHVCL